MEDKCPKVRSAVACAIGMYAIGLEMNDEACEFVEMFVEWLETALVIECGKDVRREMLIALQHCCNSLMEEDKEYEGRLSIIHQAFIDPLPSNNELFVSADAVHSTFCHDETGELLRCRSRTTTDSCKDIHTPPPYPVT